MLLQQRLRRYLRHRQGQIEQPNLRKQQSAVEKGIIIKTNANHNGRHRYISSRKTNLNAAAAAYDVANGATAAAIVT